MSQTKLLRSNVIKLLGKSGLVSKKLLEAFSHNPHTAFWYALKVLGHPWPEGENAISQDAGASLAYARDVLHKPWPMGEPTIFKDWSYTWYYGEMVYHVAKVDLHPWVSARYTGAD